MINFIIYTTMHEKLNKKAYRLLMEGNILLNDTLNTYLHHMVSRHMVKGSIREREKQLPTT